MADKQGASSQSVCAKPRKYEGTFSGLADIVALMAVDEHILASEFLKVLDLVGTFVFAISGAVSWREAQNRSFWRARIVFRRGHCGGNCARRAHRGDPSRCHSRLAVYCFVAGRWVGYFFLVPHRR